MESTDIEAAHAKTAPKKNYPYFNRLYLYPPFISRVRHLKMRRVGVIFGGIFAPLYPKCRGPEFPPLQRRGGA